MSPRQKIQGQHLNWFIVEQLPLVPSTRYEAVAFGPKTAGEIVRRRGAGTHLYRPRHGALRSRYGSCR